MPGPSKGRAASAHHEAGHAVVGFWEGVSTRLVTVSVVPDPEAGTLGHVSRGKYPRVRDVELGHDGKPRHFYREFNPEYDGKQLVERRLKPTIVSCFAGVLAERRITGRGHNWAGASHDMQMANILISCSTGSERQAQKYSAYLWVVAEDAVDIHWVEVQELAQKLLVRDSMTGREVTAFLRTRMAAKRLELERLGQAVLSATNQSNPPSPEGPMSSDQG